MLDQDKFDTLNQANHLLNNKHAKLGLKPMMVAGTNPDLFRAALERKMAQKVVNANTTEREPLDSHNAAHNMHSTVADLRTHYQQPTVEAKPITQPVIETPQIQASRANFGAWVLALIILAIGAVFAYQLWTNSLASIDESETILITSEDKPLVISSGIYSKRSEAQKMKAKVEEITGDTVRIIKQGKTFTLQIGESYKRREDAYLMFDELLKYPLQNLAIHSQA